MDYLDWNNLIASHFFRPEMAGRKVFLYVTSELLDELGKAHSTDATHFIAAVISGPPWATQEGLCRRARESLRDWRSRGLAYPPYLAYLGLFALAAGLEGDFAPHAYYPRLRTLIGEEPVIGQYPHFNYMHSLWEDLETWSQVDMAGGLGIFEVFLASKMLHVGIPIAQTLLTEAEANTLPRVFAFAGLDPNFPPSDESLANVVRVAGEAGLRNRTTALLGHGVGEHSELRAALIQILKEELLAWDGTVAIVQSETPREEDQAKDMGSTSFRPAPERKFHPSDGDPDLRPHAGHVFGSLRLSCLFDRISQSAILSVLCRSSHPLPDEGLILHRPGHADSYTCDELAGGWSTPLHNLENGTAINGSLLDWSVGAELVDSTGIWHFRLPPNPVRIFISAQSFGIAGLIEEVRLSPAESFYVAVRRDCADRIARWGAASCIGFQEFVNVSGVPAGWRFFRADEAKNDDQVREAFPILAFQQSTSLRTEGGVRVDGLNQFFNFAPPRLLLDGAGDGVEVMCNGTVLVAEGTPQYYELPTTATGGRMLLEAWRHGEIIARRNLWLVGDMLWPSTDPVRFFDSAGAPLADVTLGPTYVGARVEGPESGGFVPPLRVDYTRTTRVILIGRIPGQIATCPVDPMPTSWTPIWRIDVRRKNGQAYYCGDDEEDSVSDADTGNRKCLAQWKEALWHQRRRLSLPPDHRPLWKQYVLRARNV